MAAISTEQLDELQFGRQLHQRPTNAQLVELVARAMIEAMTLAELALEQAQDCIRGETPEDMTAEEAREDTIGKIREALRAIEAALREAGVTK